MPKTALTLLPNRVNMGLVGSSGLHSYASTVYFGALGTCWNPYKVADKVSFGVLPTQSLC